jgi:hypothetical protein
MPDQPMPDLSESRLQPATLQGLKASFVPDLLISIVGPLLIYQLLSPHLPAIDALLLAGVLPAARTVIGLVRHRRLNPFGVLALLTIALEIFSGLLLKNARLLLLSDSLPMGCLGLLALASLLTQKPLITRLAEYLLAGAPPEQREQIEKRRQSAGMRSFSRLLTAIWGGGLFLELAIRAVLVSTLTPSQVLLISPVLRYGFLGGLLLLTLLLGRIRRGTRQRTLLEEVPEQQAQRPTRTPV